ncbi:unnamed protein product [Lactuca saligna]|uniref:non-specific serine/threonine protein kinase n=1 Tax=Lactuca saligna TaxID=75948 RepID=A0AA35YDW5_LACSI|nr:unnamed protein product [Lactuca saligna]
MSSSGVHLEKFLIPLEEIHSATKYFGYDNMLQIEGFSEIYTGQLSERWQNRVASFKRLRLGFYNEVEMMSTFNHKNIIRFIGYCDEDNELIMVSEYAINGSLDQHLQDPNKRRSLTWAQRLKICLGVATGLNYLHSGLGEHNIIVHRDIKSASILLDDNLEAKICSFGLSICVDRNQPQVYQGVAHTTVYMDPNYNYSSMPRVESDVYSFGWVLFEILSGMLAYGRRTGDNKRQSLSMLVQLYFGNKVDNLIDPYMRDHINMHSFHIIKDIAGQCIRQKDRPSINMIIRKIEEALHIQNHGVASTSTIRSDQQDQSLESFFIPLNDIIIAAKNFDPKSQVGDGGFGEVYKGQLSERWQNSIVAIKRLNREGHQGKNEFLTEIKLISRFHHENIIPFVGYCDEKNEMILVYKYASNSSLDQHLYDPNRRRNLTWARRLKICLGAARGLNYLHSCLGEHNRVIHKDVKSGNILLDENMEAKICDFGLSKEGPRNQQYTQMYTKAAGTNFYMCPIYRESNILRKESDVYSFGVVLFEMLSGMLAHHRRDSGDGNPQILISLVRRYFKEGLDRLIDPLIKDQIDSRCFRTFKDIAHQCISYNIEERPTMDKIVEGIENAMNFQGREM